jgi:hypothetical protein
VWTRREVLRAGVLAAGLSAVGEPESGEVLPTGIEAVDAALGGGFSLGRVVAVAGPPGLTALTFVRHVVAHAPWRRPAFRCACIPSPPGTTRTGSGCSGGWWSGGSVIFPGCGSSSNT